ncbi:glycosyltransferase family 4 protein [Lutibacter flavus]|uniref:Glycosyltransferase involved in cell wall bisynthesis n=1 Tax=Lutibacter flavus TaxID=691689 RepID=A0A238XZY8_9FLAO|nr:glycosyltransferase family 4 protein [Lutibacter flavus]SNR64616.1 Glycosyltransferase involved in cell wall bisynthesis [Lutibacter flavus]
MDKKLHILFLSSWYPSKVSPSNGDFIQRHAEAVATKHNVTLIHVISDKNLKINKNTFQVINNVKTHIFYLPETNNRIYKLYNFFKSYISTIKTIKYFDVVHVNITFPVGMIALYLKWFKNKNYIISEHWSKYQYPHNISIGILEKFITKIIAKNASFISPVTRHLQHEMIDFGLNGNFHPIPNVVNTDFFNISKNKPKEFTITHVSGMDTKIKNIEGILRVISKLQTKIPNIKFNLIGNNSIKYKTFIEELKIKNIQLIEQIPNHEVANYMQNSNVFVMFSNYENLPCVILESFACGVPVISTNVGGIKEYFPSNFGFLIPSKDEVALENAILKISNNDIRFDKILIHNYARENFGVKTISNSFSKLYFKILT